MINSISRKKLGAISAVFCCNLAISQNNFPTPTGIAEVGSNGVITANHKFEVYGTGLGDNHLGIGGVAPSISFYGGTTSYQGTPPFGSQFGKVALATGAGHFMNGSDAGDLVIQNMGTSAMPLPYGTDGRSILFSSHFESGNGIEHMRINENGRVGIGTYNIGSGALDRAKLRVLNYDDQGQSTIERFGTQSMIEAVADICSDCYMTPLIGVGGEATTWYPDKYLLKGVQGKASYGLDNWGGYFESYSDCEHYRVPGAANFGIQAKASGNWNTYGVWAEATCAFANQFAVWSNGMSYSTGGWLSSDRKLKQDIRPFTNAIDKLMQLKPSTYTFKTGEYSSMNLPEGLQIGLIAQELETVFPEMVKQVYELTVPDDKGNKIVKNPDFKAVNYVELIPVLIKGIQEQQDQISQQDRQIADLKALISSFMNIENKASMVSPTFETPLKDENAIILDQNSPNPFAESTIIKYVIPNTFNKAQIVFSNNQGVVIKTIDITVKGNGSLTVYGHDLTHGVYSYALIIDGKKIDGKTMIKE